MVLQVVLLVMQAVHMAAAQFASLSHCLSLTRGGFLVE
jgi:hypothetical protein